MNKRIVSMSSILLVSTPSYGYEMINNDIAYLDFYGDIKASALFLDRKDNEYSFGDSKIGVRARYAITDLISIAGGTEAQVNLDADEDKNEDEIFISQYFVGLYAESLGALTYGKHSTSSDDLSGTDYSEVFGGKSNLNSVGVKGDTIKYVYDNELFTLNGTYGFESGEQKRTLAEFFGQYKLADLILVSGIGSTETNATNNKTDALYFHTTARLEMGDTNLGVTYYHQNFNNDSQPSRSVDKNAFAIAGQIAFTVALTGYAGHEVINQDSANSALTGTQNNSYLGVSLVPLEYTKLFAEVNFNSPIQTPDETNFALGAAIAW